MEVARAKDHGSYGSFTAIAILFPLIGFILSIVHIAKKEDAEKKLGEHLLAVSILCSIIWTLLFFSFFGEVMRRFVTNLSPASDTATSAPSIPIETPRIPAVHVGSLLYAENVAVKLAAVSDPATPDQAYYTATSGKRYVAVKLELENKGSETVSDSANNNTSIIGSDGQTYSPSYTPIKGCTNFGMGVYKLAPQGTAVGCVMFEIPQSVSPAKVRFTPDSGFSEVTDEWQIP